MQHSPDVIDWGDKTFTGRCTCKARGPRVGTRWQAEDWGTSHLREVERARSHLRGRSPSLRDQYAYYRLMQLDPDTPDRERDQWKVLADGLEHRLGTSPHTEGMF